jgi:hypothetical protein
VCLEERRKPPGDLVNSEKTLARTTGGMLLSLGITAVLTAGTLQAQVGLTSTPTQVVLVVHSEPYGTINAVGAPALHSTSEAMFRELSVPLKLSANTAYRLLVVGGYRTGTGAKRILVRAEDGEFRELESGQPVTVARGNHTAGEAAVEVFYRIDADGTADAGTLPVRYEIAIAPTL